ncbi:MAG: HAD-IIA family hydrolase [Lachnospiraceae bacterium]|nr:HAD-IIA family hydrolase [Lachnospiraceae bacterium]
MSLTAQDWYGKDAAELFRKKLWLFDMDGTIYEENRIFDGTIDLLKEIRARGGRYVFLTNNSSRSLTDYVKNVTNMGIDAGPGDFFTSVQATVMYLKEHHPGALVYCQGTRSLVEGLRSEGIRVTEEDEAEVTVVVVGFDTELTFDKLRRTCEILRRDVAYIATNPDFVCPVEGGFVPDCGSMCIGIRYATGKEPYFIGKPEPTMVYTAMERFGASKEETVLIGDRLYTDIASGKNAGVTTVCVLSGEATEKDIAAFDPKPDLVMQDVRAICTLLQSES